MSPKKKVPTPDDLLAEVQGLEAAKTYAFEDYLPVIDVLKKKGHSYSDIASFIKERLGITASRGQVYRAYQIWLANLEPDPEGIQEVEEWDDEDEVESELNTRAQSLIDSLKEDEARGAGEPWLDPEVLLKRAYERLRDERLRAERDEQQAAEEDSKLGGGPKGTASK